MAAWWRRGGALSWFAAVLAVTAAIALIAQAPVALRRLSAFRVERVEVLGTRYLAPHEALAASGITRTSNIFDDPEPWRTALLAHPMVAAVTIERRLPSTIVLRVEEVAPVALVRTPELRPVDAGGRVLPIDLSAGGLDLPVVHVVSRVGADGRLESREAVALVAAVERLRTLQPGLARRVSEVAPAGAGALRLLLRDPARAEVLLSAELDPVRLEQLRLTIADLEGRRELPSVRRIDVRFRDQVVVSLIPSAET